jgi:hypothetical protein
VRGPRRSAERKESGSFLKKRAKKLLNPEPSLSGEAEAKCAKVFCFFFSKKKTFLSQPSFGSAETHRLVTADRIGADRVTKDRF